MVHSNLFKGGCHCGNLTIEFGTSRQVGDLIPRVCGCSFCSKHGASYIFDSAGSLRVAASDADTLGEYRQGLKLARFLVCRRCGVLVAAVFDDEAGSYGALNARCLEGAPGLGAPQLIPPRESTGEQRRTLWAKVWTPGVRVVVSGA